jgi:putative NADH-flavin reductase
VDTPGFPEQYKGTALGTGDALNDLRAEMDLEWTFLSPSAVLEPGSRTGKFRLGSNQLLVNANGRNRMSVEDYAVALLDELETPQHIRQRFTVGYLKAYLMIDRTLLLLRQQGSLAFYTPAVACQ